MVKLTSWPRFPGFVLISVVDFVSLESMSEIPRLQPMVMHPLYQTSWRTRTISLGSGLKTITLGSCLTFIVFHTYPTLTLLLCSPARETAGNTIGGDFFGHVGDAPITRAEVSALMLTLSSHSRRGPANLRLPCSQVQAERARPLQLAAAPRSLRWRGSVGQMLAAQAAAAGRGRAMRVRDGQILAAPLKALKPGCQVAAPASAACTVL